MDDWKTKTHPRQQQQRDTSRKLPPHLENHIDDALLDVFRPMRPFLRDLGFTPDALTLLSGVFFTFSALAIFMNHFGWAALFYGTGYAFDVFDGNFARCYGLVSSRGDFLDHWKDVIGLFVIYIVFIFNPDIPISWKVFFVLVSLCLAILTSIYFGCQEIYHHRVQGQKPKGSTFMAPFRFLCYGTKNESLEDIEKKLQITRWTGSGTWAFFFVTFLVAISLSFDSKMNQKI